MNWSYIILRRGWKYSWATIRSGMGRLVPVILSLLVFRVEALERGDNCSISCRLIFAPETQGGELK